VAGWIERFTQPQPAVIRRALRCRHVSPERETVRSSLAVFAA